MTANDFLLGAVSVVVGGTSIARTQAKIIAQVPDGPPPAPSGVAAGLGDAANESASSGTNASALDGAISIERAAGKYPSRSLGKCPSEQYLADSGQAQIILPDTTMYTSWRLRDISFDDVSDWVMVGPVSGIALQKRDVWGHGLFGCESRQFPWRIFRVTMVRCQLKWLDHTGAGR